MRKGIVILLVTVLLISACQPKQADESLNQESLLAWWRANGQPPVDYVISKFQPEFNGCSVI